MKYHTSLFLASLISTGAIAQTKEKPNIVFFLVDDMGWQETSVPFHCERTPLNDIYNTPNMERLAAQGMKFTSAYACPLSSPSRVSLMTGVNAMTHQVTNWTLIEDVSPDRHYKNDRVEVPQWNINGMSAEKDVDGTYYCGNTLPALLGKCGYKTIHVGKAHWGVVGQSGENPLTLGFEVNIAGHAAGGPGSYHGQKNFSAAWRSSDPADSVWNVPGLEKYHGQDINLTEALTLEATKEIESAVAEKRPFYLYMSHYAIHAPWEADSRFVDKYRNMGLSEFMAVYASMVESMDKSLGDIMQHLRRLGVDDNTIIVFMSDNGQPSQSVANAPLRGHKISPYEGGIRVPMIVRMPGVTPEASVCNDYTIIEDIFPSILEMAGVENYAEKCGKIDGISIMPMLKGRPTADPERPIFWHFPHIYGVSPYSIIRKGDWKLIYYYDSLKTELYNLNNDISESQNLAEVNVDKCRELGLLLTKELKRTGAAIPIDKKTGEAVALPQKLF